MNTLWYTKSCARKNSQFVMSFERCCRRIDLLVDSVLCNNCKEEIDDLKTQVLNQNCRQCRFVPYLLQKADDLDVHVQKSDMTLEECFGCFDMLLDYALCDICVSDKNKLDLDALATWTPNQNCNECRNLLYWADHLSLPFREDSSSKDDYKEDPPSQ